MLKRLLTPETYKLLKQHAPPPYRAWADANMRKIKDSIDRAGNPEGLSDTIQNILDTLTEQQAVNIRLPAMHVGMASHLLMNMGLWLGNMQHVREGKPAPK
jgi:hypothetical protein